MQFYASLVMLHCLLVSYDYQWRLLKIFFLYKIKIIIIVSNNVSILYLSVGTWLTIDEAFIIFVNNNISIIRSRRIIMVINFLCVVLKKISVYHLSWPKIILLRASIILNLEESVLQHKHKRFIHIIPFMSSILDFGLPQTIQILICSLFKINFLD